MTTKKKMDLFLNGNYVCTSSRYSTCKDFVKDVKRKGTITVASVPTNKIVKIKETDNVKAHYSR